MKGSMSLRNLAAASRRQGASSCRNSSQLGGSCLLTNGGRRAPREKTGWEGRGGVSL